MCVWCCVRQAHGATQQGATYGTASYSQPAAATQGAQQAAYGAYMTQQQQPGQAAAYTGYAQTAVGQKREGDPSQGYGSAYGANKFPRY